jgi:putative transcriptional regulator
MLLTRRRSIANIPAMSQIKAIRDLLDLTQTQLADGIGCTQGNIGHYERGQQVIPPDRAATLIEFSATHGLHLTLDQVYGLKPLPAAKARAA